MNIFTIFFGQNCSKIYSKTHQGALFLIFFGGGAHAPDPPLANAWLGHAQHGAKPCKYPYFLKLILPPPPHPKMKS